MLELERATRLTGEGGRYLGHAAADWESYPGVANGGHVASLALRAAGLHLGVGRPLSVYCSFAAPTRIGPVELLVKTRSAAKRAACVELEIQQQGACTALAIVWAASESEKAYEFQAAQAPQVAAPLSGMELDLSARAACFQHVEFRSLMVQPSEPGAPRLPEARAWHRYKPVARYEDPFVDAGRALFICDARSPLPLAFLAGQTAGAIRHQPRNIDLFVQFHAPMSAHEWLMVEAKLPTGSDGSVRSQTSVWSESGVLLATGTSTLVCLP